MTEIVEVIIIIVGVVLLIASVIFTGNDKRKGDSNSSFSDEEIAERKVVIDRLVQEALAKTMDKVITNADDTMGQICDEKIIAINEYSETLLNKMKENDDHTVFMYNMLNQKEDELKQTLTDMELARQESKNAVATVTKLTKQLNSAIKKTDKKSDTTPVETKKPAKTAKAESKLVTVINEAESIPGQQSLPEIWQSDNKNQEILRMHKEGRSVLEISKALNLGQGEVRLVINLYGA